MRTILITLALTATLGTQAGAASVTLRYWNGSAAAQISGLKNNSTCEALARQKRLSPRYYYCLETGQPFDYSFERKNGWK